MGDQSGVRIGSDSSIEIDFYYSGVRCRERIKLPPTDKNIQHCERLKARIEHEIATKEFVYEKHFPNSPKVRLFARMPGDNLTIETYIKAWLDEEKQNVRHSTLEGYKQVVSCYIIPVFGQISLSELTRRHIKDWMAKRTDISPKTLGNILSPLRIALDEAVEDELIELSPLAGWRIKRLKQNRRHEAAAMAVWAKFVRMPEGAFERCATAWTRSPSRNSLRFSMRWRARTGT